MLIAPEQAATEQKEQCEDGEFDAGDALLSLFTMVPGKDKHDRQTDQQRETRELLQMSWPVEERADVREALQETPRTGDVGNAPLPHLAAAQSSPEGCRPPRPVALRSSGSLPVGGSVAGLRGSTSVRGEFDRNERTGTRGRRRPGGRLALRSSAAERLARGQWSACRESSS